MAARSKVMRAQLRQMLSHGMLLQAEQRGQVYDRATVKSAPYAPGCLPKSASPTKYVYTSRWSLCRTIS
jgi:hypothetical protein